MISPGSARNSLIGGANPLLSLVCLIVKNTVELYHFNKSVALDFVRTLLPVKGEKLKQTDRLNYLIFYGAYVLERSGLNGQFPLRQFVHLLNEYAQVVITPEPMSSTICFVCLTKGIESFVVRKKNKSFCQYCDFDYHADSLGAGDILYWPPFD